MSRMIQRRRHLVQLGAGRACRLAVAAAQTRGVALVVAAHLGAVLVAGAAGHPQAVVVVGPGHVGAAVAAMIRSLEVEENRVDVSVRQGLGLKECAPDDLCDICEGSTWHVGEQGGYALEPRLRPVRALS